jgi:hypothetical protein
VIRGLVAAGLALIVLTLDFFLFPDLVEDRVEVPVVAATDVVGGQLVTLGKYRLHTLRVSYGRLIDEEYVSKLGKRVNGLVVAAYPATENTRASIGGLRDDNTTILSENETVRLGKLVLQGAKTPLGTIQSFKPKKDEAGSLHSIDTILLLYAKGTGDREAKDALRDGLVNLLNESGRHQVTGLLLPALTVGIAEKGTPTFDDFFHFLFDALEKSQTPRLIDLTLYAGWPTEDLQSAVAALNAHWATATSRRTGTLPALHRLQLRLVLIGLAICFVVSSRHVLLGLKTTTILAIGFALSLLGSFKSIETVSDGLGPDVNTVALIVFTLIVAVGFPYFVHWSVKDLFKEKTDGAQ